jgi:T5SS/PEP-CTERM-associated repeat protein
MLHRFCGRSGLGDSCILKLSGARRRRQRSGAILRAAIHASMSATIGTALICDSPACAASTWNAGSSNWNNPANWTPSGVPGAGAVVDITHTDGVSRVISYDYTGSAVTLASLTIDLTGNNSNADTLAIPGHNLSAGSEYAGDSGAGTGGVGAINQSGGSNTVGNLDLGVNASDAGYYNLNSSAATLTATTTGFMPYSIVVGDNGSGTMNVGSGSTVTAQQSAIGNAGGSTGEVTVDDSTWKNTSFTYVGLNGTGTLAVQNDAHFTSGDIMDIGVLNNGSGTLAISGGGSVVTSTTGINGTNSTTLGVGADTTGTLTIDGAGSVLQSNGDMAIGYSGTATAMITNGGSLLLDGTIFRVGRNGGSNGTLTVDGAGSNVNSSSSTMYIGYGGTGAVTVQNDAWLTVVGTDIGGLNVNLGTGTLSVDGTGTQASLGEVTDGDAGTGTLNVTGGATAKAGDLTVGLQNTGTGNLVVSDAGSGLTVNGLLKIGDAGDGLTEVLGSATISAGSLTIGASAGGGGSLGLGTGSACNTSGDAILGNVNTSGGNFYIGGTGAAEMTVGGNLTVGNGGYGYLTVSGGSALSVKGSFCAIGAEPTANGTIIVSGSSLGNSSSLLASSIVIGGTLATGGGYGNLTTGAGGIVQATTSVQIWPNGTLDASGGGAVTVGTGSLAGSNTLEVNHGSTLSGAGLLDVIAVVNAGTFTQTGTLIETGNFTNMGTASIGGSQNWSHGSVFTNNAGAATFQTDAGANGSNLAVNVSGGSVTFAATQHLAALNVAAGATAVITGGGSGNRSVVFTPMLSDGGTVNVGANDLDLQAGGAAGLATVNGLLKQGYSNGSWTGTGIDSTAAAGDTRHLLAVGVIVNNAAGSPIYSLFDGAGVGLNDVLVKETYYGDANLDGKVDGADYSRIDSAYLADKTNPTADTGWSNGDFNYDGVINGSDYTLMDNAFNTQGAQLSAEIATATAQLAGPGETAVPETAVPEVVVPEPGAMELLMMGVAGLLGRRGRRVAGVCSFNRRFAMC